MWKVLSVAISVLAVASGVGQETNSPSQMKQLRYVAIGDSYSIGEGATPNESWPALLTRHLKTRGVAIDLVANPSVTGWTTEQAIDQELPVFVKAKPTFATLQIGVNDWVQGVDEKAFRQRFSFLLDRMLELLGDKGRLLVITIPDFGVTPTGPKYARGRDISAGIAKFNQIVAEEATKRGAPVVDVYPLSQKMRNTPSLVASDGLHPSAKEYQEWEKIIFPVALELLKK
jgi:lysophospholipase L1-like esterase